MKIMVSFLSALIAFIGIIPLFGENFFIPNSGVGYSIVLMALGILVIIAAIINGLLMMLEKAFLIFQGVLLVIVAILPLLPEAFSFLPTQGMVYSIIIIIIGGIGLIYGLIGMG